jgi:hypothetical protein
LLRDRRGSRREHQAKAKQKNPVRIPLHASSDPTAVLQKSTTILELFQLSS